MLATLCSKSQATNPAIGGIIARIRSVVVRALKQSQTAMQTMALHMIPSATAWMKLNWTFALAVARAAIPMEPLPNLNCSAKYIMMTVRIDPTKLPTNTMAQFLTIRPVL